MVDPTLIRAAAYPIISRPSNEHFGDVIDPHAIGIAVDEEHRRFCSFEFLGAKIVRLASQLYDVLYEGFELVRCRTQTFYTRSRWVNP